MITKLNEKKRFRWSYKFDVPSVYHNGCYYFPDEHTKFVGQDGENKVRVTVVYHIGKWRQDLMTISEALFNEIQEFAGQTKRRAI